MASGGNVDPEDTYTKAAKAELAKDYDLAFQLYIKAVEDFLHQSRTSTGDKLRQHCKSRASVALQRAEKIKSVKRNLTPVLRNIFSEQSQLSVITKSSRVNGRALSLWSEPRNVNEDSSLHPDLSPAQIKCASIWKAPIEIDPQMCLISPLLQPSDLCQRIVTDCSVCASLVICLEHHRRFNSKLGMSSLFPQDEIGMPCVSNTNVYDVRLQYNGASRRIVIDDKLPVSSVNNELTCLSTGCRKNYWPALIEKAYMKLMGGYDFLGSRSSIDLHVLIGWVPDYVEMDHPTFQREKTWARVVKGFAEGRCILTLGSFDRDDVYWRNVHIISSHCYAVIDILEYRGQRQVKVLDSRAQKSSDGSPLVDSEPGVLLMTWDEVCQVFRDLCLSWDPSLFTHRLSFHGLWKPKRSSTEDGTGSHQHLRLKMSLIEEIEAASPVRHFEQNIVWVLLSRHVADTQEDSEYIALKVEGGLHRKIEPQIDHIADKGTYTNSSVVLFKATPLEISEGVLSLIASYDGDREDVGFTLEVFSTNIALSWDEFPTKLPFSQKVDGLFTAKNCGGNHAFSSYMTNPQYNFHIHPSSGTAARGQSRDDARGREEKAHVRFVGQVGRDTALNICVVWSNPKRDRGRIFDLVQTDIVCSSGAYSYGYAATSGDLSAGDYTIIISTFEPQQHLGPFALRIESSQRFGIYPIPQEGAGMYSKVVKGSWEGTSAAGGPSFNRYSENPVFELHVPSACQLKARLQLLQPSPSVLLNITVFPASDTFGQHVATSGPYSDFVSGAATPLTPFKPGNYLIVPSTFQPGIEKYFRIEVLSSVGGVKVTPRKPR